MERYDREAIDTFMSITGVSEAIAIRKLEEHGGNLNEAVNAHFSEGDRIQTQEESLAAAPYDFMDIDDPVPRSTLPSLPFTRDLNPFSLLDSNIGSLLGSSSLATRTPFVTHPREVREIPIEVKDDHDGSGQSGRAPSIVDVSELHEHGPEVHGPVIIDDEDDHASGVSSTNPGPSAPTVVDLPDYSDDIEEEMIRAAIEASKQDAALSNNVGDSVFQPKLSGPEDAELAHAVSLSLQTAEQEKAIRGLEGNVVGTSVVTQPFPVADEMEKLANGRHSRLEAGSTSFEHEAEYIDDIPLVRQGRRRVSSSRSSSVRNIEEVDDSPPSSPPQQHNNLPSQYRGSSFPGYEWGGISSEEHDEAVMLEAAMFGGIPEAGGFQQNGPGSLMGSYTRRVHNPPSPSLAAQRLIREQQDDEYLASLQADQEKELKAKEEAEAALAEERRIEAELSRKLQEEQENERQLAAKEASLPQEPSADDENAVTLLVRMPDGSRRGRRFLKSDKLQCLFDFIDIGRAVKAESYRLVRSYPRRGFGHGDGMSSFDELGLSSKHEALYLELI